MFSTNEEVVKYIAENDVEVFDIRFCDLPGVMQHLTVPASTARPWRTSKIVPFMNVILPQVARQPDR